MSEEETEKQPIPIDGKRSIIFSIPSQKYMKLLIKIRHENLNWKRFFNFVIDGFIEDDPGLMKYIDDRMIDLRAKKRTKILTKERQKELETIDVFGLDEDEISNIYDILEEEFEP